MKTFDTLRNTRPTAGRQPTQETNMDHKPFVRLAAQRNTEAAYEAIINPQFIKFVVPSSETQVGKSIVHLVRTSENRNTVAATLKLEALAREIPSLREVQIYSTSSREVTGPGLVNLGCVVELTENPGYVHLEFVDGEQLNVVGKLI